MDFDDLEDVEASFGPTPAELREELSSKQDPLTMPNACLHPRPAGKNFAVKDGASKQKMLYLHGTGSNAKMGRRQVNAVFKNSASFKQLEFEFYEGTINFRIEQIHADPEVAKLFIPYGNKCGDTYDGYYSHMIMYGESHNNETWLGPSHGADALFSGKYTEQAEGCGYVDALDSFAEHLEKNGPYDGLVGFDIGAALALDAARLAQEGDKRFMEKFRYMVLLCGRGHRELAGYGQGCLRPKAPLQIPTLMAWSDEDDSKQYSAYEELALYIHPSYRSIIKHDQGNRPPNLQKGVPELEVLDAFLKNMEVDKTLPPDESSYKDYWLPLVRDAGPSLPEDASVKIIFVGDPHNAHGPLPEESVKDRLRFPAQEHPSICAKRLEIFRMVTGMEAAEFTKSFEGASSVEVLSVEYNDEHRKLAWHPEVKARDVSQAYGPGQGRSRWLQAEDEIAVPWVKMRFLAEELLETISVTREDTVAIVGFGTGAHVAFALAEAVMRIKSVVPIRLITVCPPTVWPLEDIPAAGALVNTPIRYLTCPESVAGPPWRLETSTYGPVSHSYFSDKESLLKLIVDEMSSLSS
jgi:pimeloyl-ACP methyl ester carboxylesterase